jgi:protein TonB
MQLNCMLGGPVRARVMTLPAAIRIDPQAFVPECRRAEGKLARLRPVGTDVGPWNAALPRHGQRPRSKAMAAWILSLLVHGAAVAVLLTLVQPPAAEIAEPESGISMVFADAAPPPADPDPPVATPSLPDAVQPPEPPAQATATTQSEQPAAASEVPMDEAPAVLPVPPAPPPPMRPSHPAAPRLPHTENLAHRTAPAAPVPLAPAAPVERAAIIPPRPVAGMADNRPPRYPESARRRQEQGRVMVGVSVATDGTPIEARIERSSGHPALDEAAVEAVRQWRFVPGRQDDRPVVASAEVPIVFHLQD